MFFNGIGSPNWKMSMVDIRIRILLWVYYLGHAGLKGNDGADRLVLQNHRLASRKILSVEELETLPAGTKPRASHHQSPGGETRRPSHL